ncbi:MAG: ABC transporter ATP-binding protein, partial [Schaedlerella arabinosiphila]|nr:ABC transporter ATP-binding protein [Schaedlerella arabinosiphila]
QQQRAAILRSIANRPPILLCDEPTGSLNSAQTEIVMDLLEELNKNGQTIIVVTHDIQVAVRGKRVLYIEDGRIEGELKVTESGDREEKLIRFLQKKGW